MAFKLRPQLNGNHMKFRPAHIRLDATESTTSQNARLLAGGQTFQEETK